MPLPSFQTLLSRWEQAYLQGQDLPLEQLCEGQPELLDNLRQAIETLRRILQAIRTRRMPPQQDAGPLTTYIPTIPPPDSWETLAPDLVAVAPPGYEILDELGRGGMGVVYLARQTGFNRLCALKTILAGHHAGADELSRFTTEAQALARLQHPNIVTVFEIGHHAGQPFYSMEFCPADSLARILGRSILDAKVAAALVETLARAMHAAHQVNIVHRDLKPANVLLTPESGVSDVPSAPGTNPLAGLVPKISDFGLAKKLDEEGPTSTGAVMGTPSYMAPEQAQGCKAIGPAVDVYSLGAILYQCLTGRPPFHNANPIDTISQLLHDDPAPPRRLQANLPLDVETICLECLQKDPRRRYPDALALAEDLRRFRHGEPIEARRIRLWERGWKWCRRRPALASLTGLCVLSLLSLMIGAGFYVRTEHRLRQQAQEEGQRAERHFSQARQAVEEMLTRVGEERLVHEPRMEQIRRDLLEKAVVFYEQFLREQGDAPVVRHETALAWRKVAQIRALLGQNALAEKAYRRALSLLAGLTNSHSGQLPYHQDLAAVCADLGNLLRRMGRPREAEPLLSRAIRTQELLVDQVEGARSLRRDLASFHHNLGLVRESLSERTQAETCQRQALALQQSLAGEFPSDPGLRLDLVRTWTTLGNLLAQDRPDEAEKALTAALALLERTGRTVADLPATRQELLLAYLRLGDLLQTRKPAEAIGLFERAAEQGLKLHRDFPSVPDYQHLLAASLNSLGSQYLFVRRFAEAEKALERSLELKQKLVEVYPRQGDFRRDLARTFGNRGLLRQATERPGEAAADHGRAVEFLRELAGSGPADHVHSQELALALVRWATVLPGSERDQAEKLLRDALTLQDRLVEQLPAGRDHRDERGRTCTQLALVLYAKGNTKEAESLHRRAESDFRVLHEQHPREPEYRHLLGLTLTNLADLLRHDHRPRAAEKMLLEAITWHRELVKEKPDQPAYRRELGRGLHNLGFLHNADGQHEKAERTHQEALALRAELCERFPAEPNYRHDLARSHGELAISLRLLEKAGEAEKHFRQAVGILTKLVEEYPGSLIYANDLLSQQANFARFLGDLGCEKESIEFCKLQLRLQLALADQEKDVPTRRGTAGRALHTLAERLLRLQRWEEASKNFELAIEKQKSALAQTPTSAVFQQDLCEHYLGLASALLGLKDHAGAARAVEQIQTIAPGDWQRWPMAATQLARCAGLVSEDEKQAKVYGDRVLFLLGKAKEAGFRDGKALAEMKEFAPLRKREDFRRLVEELSARK